MGGGMETMWATKTREERWQNTNNYYILTSRLPSRIEQNLPQISN